MNFIFDCRYLGYHQREMALKIADKFVKKLETKADENIYGEGSYFKIINITDCKSSDDAFMLLVNQEFRESFQRDKNCFVIVMEIDDNLKALKEPELFEGAFDTSKPIIISFESTLSCQFNVIYYKEANEKSFNKILRDDQEFWLQEMMEDGFNVSFNLELLLRALQSGSGGSFNGKFLETTLDIKQTAGKIFFINRAAYNNNIMCLKFLRLFEFNLSEPTNENKKLLETAARSCDYQGFLALLDLPFDCDITEFLLVIESLEVLYQNNSEGYNLLMVASESGNAEAVNLLTKCTYDVNQKKDLKETAASLAWQKENYEIFVKLLQENSLFPKDFHEKFKSQKGRGKVKTVLNYLSDLNSFHESIKRGRIDRVEEFLVNHPTTRHAYNTKNESAAAIALKSEQFAVYDFLISQGIVLGPHEDIAEILSVQEKVDCHDNRRTMMKKLCLHEIHKKYFKEPLEKHVMILLSHSTVGFDVPHDEQRSLFKYIKEAYESLNRVEEISKILQIVTNAKFFRVVFDFKRDSVAFVDPITNKQTKGASYYNSGYIYVGARGLLTEERRHEVLGTLAHELTHYAMQLVYENQCRPYRDNDYETIKAFDTIATLCEFYKEKEPKITYVYNYSKAFQHGELIVRVPHLMALYMNDNEKLDQCRRTFKELFNFFQDKTLVDVCNEAPVMLAKRETIELNAWLGVIQQLIESKIVIKEEKLKIEMDLSKISLLLTNCVKLTATALCQQLQMKMKPRIDNFFLFAKTTAVQSEKTKNLMMKALNLVTKPTVIFECEDDVQLGEIRDVVAALNATERVLFIVKDEGDGRFYGDDYRITHFKHCWDDFPPASQDVLWNFDVNFQGKILKLRKLMTIPSKATEAIPFCNLLRRKLKVSEPLVFKEIDFFIDRKFVSQSQQTLSFDTLSDISKIILVSDDPGAGKTTTFKTFAVRLKEKFPSHWVAYLDLKQFIEVFEQNEFEEFSGIAKIAKLFAEKILHLDQFERELFSQLFADDRVIFMMDGFDEICPNFKVFIVKLLKTMKNESNNQLWISTRPHLVKELSEYLAVDYFNLKPFTKIEQRNFYYKFYEHRKIPSYELDRYVNGIEKLMAFLSKNRLFWSTITNDIISNPLFMRIAAEIYDEEAMQDVKIEKCLTMCNLYLMYERFIENKFTLWMKKGQLALTDQIDIHRSSKSIMRSHFRLALAKTFIDGRAENLVEEATLTDEQMVRVGLVTHNGSELQFIHRTFAEFFVADFLFKRIFCNERSRYCRPKSIKENKMLMRLFVKVLTFENFKMIRAFIGNALELVKHNQKPCQKQFRKLAKLFRRESKRYEREKILLVSVSDGCLNLTSLVLEFSVASQNLLLRFMHKERRDLENVLTNSFQIHRESLETIKSYWEAAKAIYKAKDIKEFLLRAYGGSRSLLHTSAATEGPELLTFLFNEFRDASNEEEFKDFLLMVDGGGQTLFEIAANLNKNKTSLRAIWDFYQKVLSDREQREFLTTVTGKHFNAIVVNNEGVLNEFLEIIETKFNENEITSMMKSLPGEPLTTNLILRA